MVASSKSHKRITVQIPKELLDDLKQLNNNRDIDWRADIVNRIRLSLQFDDTLMLSDQLKRLIFCKQLSYEYQRRKYKSAGKGNN